MGLGRKRDIIWRCCCFYPSSLQYRENRLSTLVLVQCIYVAPQKWQRPTTNRVHELIPWNWHFHDSHILQLHLYEDSLLAFASVLDTPKFNNCQASISLGYLCNTFCQPAIPQAHSQEVKLKVAEGEKEKLEKRVTGAIRKPKQGFQKWQKDKIGVLATTTVENENEGEFQNNQGQNATHHASIH